MSLERKTILPAVTLMICASLLCGCGSKKIPNTQIDDDLGNQTLKTEGSLGDWSFKADTNRCFAIADNKYSEGKAEITARVASSQMDGQENLPMEKVSAVKTLLGQVVMTYKNEGGKWVFEKAEPKELRAKAISVNDWKNTFIQIQLNLCDTFDHNHKK
jgi:hypothetical protein